MTYPPTWKWKKHGKVLEGTYAGFFAGVGKGGRSVLYAIKDKSGKTWTIWGVNEIKQALQLRKPGKKVRFEFLGMKKTKRGFMSMHFKINVGRGQEAADPTNSRAQFKIHEGATARHRIPRQSLTGPSMTVGRVVAHASAVKIVPNIEKRKRGRPKKINPSVILNQVTEPPPGPPIGYNPNVLDLSKWKERLRKI